DFVWNDTNANGIQDSGEAGIGSAQVWTSVTYTASMDANGKYLFTEVPGTYTVTVDAGNFTGTGALVGFFASPTGQGSDTAKDSNPSPTGTTPPTLPSIPRHPTPTFFPYTTLFRSDFVWNDTNANGIQDSGEA